ncbi:hypothetical protein MBLNU459_g0527t1 [Dothideomycetes sp. NU459]
MSTGTLQECYVNFPYPITGAAPWLRDIGYCLWILEVVLFGLFLAFLGIRYIRYPELLKKNLVEFPTSSFLGSIPISLNTVTQGIIGYYDYRPSARWTCFALYWIALVLSLMVSVGLVVIQIQRAARQELSDVAGVWIMVTVPMFSTALTAGNILPYIKDESTKCAVAVLVTGFMCWSLALAEFAAISTVYLFRLIANKIPPQPLLAGSYLPGAATAQGAFGIHKLSIYLATYIKEKGYGPAQVSPPPLSPMTLDATSEVIHWMGILISIFLLSYSTFWLVQGTSALLFMLPQTSWSVAYWSLVFPMASYASAWSFLGRDLHNEGMRGWAATTTMIATLLWLFCAFETTYLGVWKGSMFSAPGLEDWLGDKEDQRPEGRGGRKDDWNGTYSLSRKDEEEAQANGIEHGRADDVRRRP